MKKPILIALALVAAPLAAQAETINLYGWQNHSWEFVDLDSATSDRDFDRIQSNAGNLGFSASVDTGVNGIKVNLQCEQFTYYNHFAGGTGWCNRNSKIGLSHPTAGEIMFATWLLPYNEGVAQWVDPFYDAGADSHTSIMGSVGANTIFYNTGDFDIQASGSGPSTGFDGSEFNYAGGGYDTGFNRRQENIIQYWSPNWNGFVFRFAWTVGNRDDMNNPRYDADNVSSPSGKIDPVIYSSSLAYTNGPLWLAVTWQDHEDWSAVSVGQMESSDAESFRLAGRYIMDLGDGVSVQLSAMWEDLEYEFNNVTNFDAVMRAFGFGNSITYPVRNRMGNVVALDNTNAATRRTDFVNTNQAGTRADEAATITHVRDNDLYGTAARSTDDEVRRAIDNAQLQGMRDIAGGPDVANAVPAGTNSNVKVERDAWMVSGKVKFGGPIDFRFSYMDADDLEVSCGACTGDWNDTAADAWNIGLFYTMPAGTELRLTYSEVDNDDNGTYGQGISGTGLGQAGAEIEMFAIGIVHWFD